MEINRRSTITALAILLVVAVGLMLKPKVRRSAVASVEATSRPADDEFSQGDGHPANQAAIGEAAHGLITADGVPIGPENFYEHLRSGYTDWTRVVLASSREEIETVGQSLARDGSPESVMKLIALTLASEGVTNRNLSFMVESIKDPRAVEVLALQASDIGPRVSRGCFNALVNMDDPSVVARLMGLVERYAKAETKGNGSVIGGSVQQLGPHLNAGQLGVIVGARVRPSDIPELRKGIASANYLHAASSVAAWARLRDLPSYVELLKELDTAPARIRNNPGLGVEAAHQGVPYGVEFAPLFLDALLGRPPPITRMLAEGGSRESRIRL